MKYTATSATYDEICEVNNLFRMPNAPDQYALAFQQSNTQAPPSKYLF